MNYKVSGKSHDNKGNHTRGEFTMEPTLIPLLATDNAKTAVDEVMESSALSHMSDVEFILSQRFDVPDEIIKKLMSS